MTRALRFKVVQGEGEQPFHVRLLAGNNEITLSGEGYRRVIDAHRAVTRIWEAFGIAHGLLPFEFLLPPYTKDSLQPKATAESSYT